MPRQGLFGRFSLSLGCSGCCQPQLRRSSWAGIGPLKEKRERKFGEQTPYVFFGWFGRQGTKLCLKMMCCPSKNLKSFFVYFLWLETKLFIKDGPSTLVGFIKDAILASLFNIVFSLLLIKIYIYIYTH